MTEQAERIALDSPERLIDTLKLLEIDLCIFGEEKYLAEGYADQCRKAHIPAWGPNQQAAQLESSKLFAKDFMERHNIPTGSFEIVRSTEELKAAVKGYPCVLKYNGLAAGKGVAVCFDEAMVDDFAREVFEEKRFGDDDVFVEEFLKEKKFLSSLR